MMLEIKPLCKIITEIIKTTNLNNLFQIDDIHIS